MRSAPANTPTQAWIWNVESLGSCPNLATYAARRRFCAQGGGGAVVGGVGLVVGGVGRVVGDVRRLVVVVDAFVVVVVGGAVVGVGCGAQL